MEGKGKVMRYRAEEKKGGQRGIGGGKKGVGREGTADGVKDRWMGWW